MRAGQSGRTGTNHRDPPPGWSGTNEWRDPRLLIRPLHQPIGRMALQRADLDWFVLLRGMHAGPLSQLFGRANPGATAAKNVRLQDGPRRSEQISRGDLANERGYVDPGRASLNAGCVMAEVAAIGFDDALRGRQRRMRVGEIRGEFGGIEPACSDIA